MRIEDLFIEPEVLHKQTADDGKATQTTRLCRSRLEPGCYLVRQTTRWGDGRTTNQQVYFTQESLLEMAGGMRAAAG